MPRKLISTGSPFEKAAGYSRAVIDGDFAFVAGTTGYDAMALVDRVRAVAETKGCTPGQLALAWVLAQGEDVVPIPGTKRVRYLEENVGATEVVLSPDDLAALAEAVPRGAVAGARYGDMGSIDV